MIYPLKMVIFQSYVYILYALYMGIYLDIYRNSSTNWMYWIFNGDLLGLFYEHI